MNHPSLPPADPLFLELQAALAGTYSIERELGRGGMGVVYLAREVRLARAVALKVLPPHLADQGDMRERFVREAQMAARLSHPNIVPIHSVGEVGDFVFFAMSYVEGETLAQHVRAHGPLPPHRAIRVLREVAWALTYAHASGIVHRDVKPENILLERGTDRALVTDFGIAVAGRADPEGHSRDGIIVGSVHYLSPEQAVGEPTDGRSDVYSLGVVAYSVLTGRVPFDAPTVQQVLSMHLSSDPAPITSLAPAVPGKLARAVERCLCKRPEDRYQTAAEFAEALDATVAVQREIPAGLRLWLASEEREFGARVAIAGLGATLIPAWWMLDPSAPREIFFIQAAVLGSIVVVPLISRTRKLFAAGYILDDLRAALRQHVTHRREELAYQVSENPGRTPLKLFAIAGVSAAIATGAALLSGGIASIPNPLIGVAFGISALTSAFCGLLGVSEWERRRAARRKGWALLKFWDGWIGDRVAKIAGWRLKRSAPQQALPQLTEVALGRATDALFESLPGEVRRELAGVPDVVRRLEQDAKTLRSEIERLDTSLGELGHDARPLTESSRSAFDSDGVRAQRDQLRDELREARTLANQKLVETVAALENVRLDLLRLRVGSVQIESVTAHLDAARQLSEHVARVVAAGDEIEAALRKPHNLPASLSPT